MSYLDDKLEEVRQVLDGYGPWRIMQAGRDSGSFGNDVAITNGQVALRFLRDRDFEHVDVGLGGINAVDWFPIEVAAVGIRVVEAEALRQHYSDCCTDLDDDTGDFRTEPMIADPLEFVERNWTVLLAALREGGELRKTEVEAREHVQTLLEGIGFVALDRLDGPGG